MMNIEVNDSRLMGKHLCFLRTTKTDLNQSQITELLNIERSTYAKYEAGLTKPGIKTIKHIATILGISVDLLFDYENNDRIDNTV